MTGDQHEMPIMIFRWIYIANKPSKTSAHLRGENFNENNTAQYCGEGRATPTPVEVGIAF